MTYNSEIHKRRSVRLKGYDYSQDGIYFVTICTKNKECIFGEILKNKKGEKSFAPTRGGEIVKKCWEEIPEHYPKVILKEFIIMPNHIHGILMIKNFCTVGAKDFSPKSSNPKGTSKTIGAIVRGFKVGVTKWFRGNTDIYEVWQRSFHEHIIRDEKRLIMIQNYIENNPEKWEEDMFFKL